MVPPSYASGCGETAARNTVTGQENVRKFMNEGIGAYQTTQTRNWFQILGKKLRMRMISECGAGWVRREAISNQSGRSDRWAVAVSDVRFLSGVILSGAEAAKRAERSGPNWQ